MAFESVHNYYESLVFRQIEEMLQDASREFREDVACVALNRLPPRYVRQSVDMLFYLSLEESAEMERRIQDSVQQAVEFVSTHLRNREGL